ncbi:MAG: ATP-binding protein [Bosea sp. (in: a-proteobacteria)]
MSHVGTNWDALIAEAARDHALAPFVAGGAMMFWSVESGDLLHANPVGQALLGSETSIAKDHAGAAARTRLRQLGQGLAPRAGVRLERLRLTPGASASLVTCACRLIPDGRGGEVLLTAAAAPSKAAASDNKPDNARDSVAIPHADTLHFEAPPAPAFQPAATASAKPPALRRFVWESDATGNLYSISPALIEALGLPADALVGRGWADLLGKAIEDRDGALAAALAGHKTWSAIPARWLMATDGGMLVTELSASPILDAAGAFAGFRGFGLVRGVEQRQMAEKPQAAPVAPKQPETAPLPPEPPVKTNVVTSFPVEPQRPPGEPAGANVVALRNGHLASVRPVLEPAKASLSPSERNAFREIAKALGARIEGDPLPEAKLSFDVKAAQDVPAAPKPTDIAPPSPVAPVTEPAAPMAVSMPEVAPIAERATLATRTARLGHSFADLLDRVPIGVLVNRGDEALYANRTLLDLLDFADVDDIKASGGLTRLIRGAGAGGTTTLVDRAGDDLVVEARLSPVNWQGEPATLMSFRKAVGDVDQSARIEALEMDAAKRDGRVSEMTAILDTATDGVVTLDERGRILALNRSAEALFGYDQREVTGELFTLLLAPESFTPALDYLEGLKGGGVASLMNDGREVAGRVRQGGRVPLFMTMGRIAETPDLKFCAVLRDVTSWKKAETELVESRKAAERSSAQKSDVLAKISHEIRTPLNAIIGFSEVMAEERFGPIGNERYKEYLRDIHESGGYLISLVNDLLDLAKIEAGKLDLDFTSVSLNDICQSSVSLLQPEAQRGRVVLRSGLAPKLPPVVADQRSIKQIIINILSNAVKFTDPGGQVIVSTALGDKGEAILRVRDTGIGMDEKELALALEPFRQVQTTRKAGGTGLGLPLTKALVEANRAALSITSARNEGTLVEITFPPQRVLAG